MLAAERQDPLRERAKRAVATRGRADKMDRARHLRHRVARRGGEPMIPEARHEPQIVDVIPDEPELAELEACLLYTSRCV